MIISEYQGLSISMYACRVLLFDNSQGAVYNRLTENIYQ